MNQTTLFNELMALSGLSDTFYSVDQIGPDHANYRIFLYRMGSYSDWLLPSGLESRGIMFREEDTGEWKLVCRPMEKFHNLNENPFTMGLDLSAVEYSMVKEDGSLISSYTGANSIVFLKTKGSMASDQATAAMVWLGGDGRTSFLLSIVQAELDGWTVNMEWTSPWNRIVVSYNTDKLIVLNARNRETGEYMSRDELVSRFGEYAVPLLDIAVDDVASMPTGEGIVLFRGNDAFPRFVKVKAEAYLRLHRLKDGVNQPNALFDAIVHEDIDDLRAAFADDQAVQVMIQEMENVVKAEFSAFNAGIDQVMETYGELDKKDFVIASRAMLDTGDRPDLAGGVMAVAINRYLGREERLIKMFATQCQKRIVEAYKVAAGDAIKDLE